MHCGLGRCRECLLESAWMMALVLPLCLSRERFVGTGRNSRLGHTAIIQVIRLIFAPSSSCSSRAQQSNIAALTLHPLIDEIHAKEMQYQTSKHEIGKCPIAFARSASTTH